MQKHTRHYSSGRYHSFLQKLTPESTGFLISSLSFSFLKFYRLMVVQLEKREALAKEAKMLEKKKAAAIKRQTSSRTSSSKRNRLNEAPERPTRRKTNRSSSGTRIGMIN